MTRETLHRARYALSILRPGALAVRPFRCPLCGFSLLLRLAPDPVGVRCIRCAASAATLALVSVLASSRPGLGAEAVYELSARGPLVAFLRRKAHDLTTSEYFDDVPPGEWRDGVLCQDVQRLTFADASFDVCTSTEVFEHVPEDMRGFREIRRVLRGGGIFVFTVPLSDAPATVVRAALEDGKVVHRLEPAYHGDRIRGRDRVLVFRDYGRDITDRLRSSGFRDASIDRRYEKAFLGQGCGVIVARV